MNVTANTSSGVSAISSPARVDRSVTRPYKYCWGDTMSLSLTQ